MKKLLLLIIVAILTFSEVNAQFTQAGVGLTFSTGYYFNGNTSYAGSKSGNIAMSLKGIYKINVPIQISPSFTFFIPHIYSESGLNLKETVTTMMFDVNGHYIFNSLDKFEFYGLAGLDILLSWDKAKYSGVGAATYRQSENALGLNIGAGSFMKLSDQFNLYLEAKYLVSRRAQFMVNADVLINIDWLKKHENTGIK